MSERPSIPQNIIVHKGAPESIGEDITIPFIDYIKKTASISAEPDWNTNTIKSIVYVIVSFALSRIFTYHYPSKGYSFDITDQSDYDYDFDENAPVYETISKICDEIFNDYIQLEGCTEPLCAQICNEYTDEKAGFSKLEAIALGEKGQPAFEILQDHYGQDIALIENAPVSFSDESFDGTPLSLGNDGKNVKTAQIRLNRISFCFPVIPKITSIDGIYSVSTESAVKAFQRKFYLNPTGMIDKATWFKIAHIYSRIKKLSDLNLEKIQFENFSKQCPKSLIALGEKGKHIYYLNYCLAVLGLFYENIKPVRIHEVFSKDTQDSLKSFQIAFSLPDTGVIDQLSWNMIMCAYSDLVEKNPQYFIDYEIPQFDVQQIDLGAKGKCVKHIQICLSYIRKAFHLSRH